MSRTLRFIALAEACCGVAFFATPVLSQTDGLPSGWQQLPPGEFLAVVYAAGELDPETEQAVSLHAWDTFLNDPSFIAGGYWPVVREMLQRFGNSSVAEAAERAALRNRVDARLAAEPGLITGDAPATRDRLYDLGVTAKSLEATGHTAANTAELFIAWMAANDWQSMDIHDLYNLYSWVNADSVDRRHFSVRWNGSLVAPFNGRYTLKQLQQYKGADSRLKVIIDGQTVLNSTSSALTDESQFTSAPVELAAGQAVPIQVDMVHDVPEINDFSEGAPMVVLTWDSDRINETIIPGSAFAPPAGFAEPGVHGLKAEYFGNTQFGDLRITRLDSALDLVWSWPPAASFHQEAAGEVFAACKSKLLDGAFLSQRAAEGNEELFHYNMWRIAYRLTATERLQLVETLIGKPDVLAVMTPEAMGRLMQAIYMLPGDEHIELLGAWANARPQPRCQPGEFPGWGEGFYQELNTDFYWLMGLFMQGPYSNDAETLSDEYLVRPDGKCNLAVAYAAAYAARANGTGDSFLAKLDERIDDQTVQGDQLMTWLVARAFARDVLPARIEPLAGFSDLESAYVVADSDAHKFWALQEMVARLSSVNQTEQAKELIAENRGRFTAPNEQAAMTDWSTKADELAARYVQRQAAAAQSAQAAYVAELEQRREQAAAQGDSAAATRFAQLISAAQQAAPPVE